MMSKLKSEIYRAETDLFYVFLKRLELEPITWDYLHKELKSNGQFKDVFEVKDELIRLRYIMQVDDIISILDNGRDYLLGNEEYIDFLKNHCLMAAEQ